MSLNLADASSVGHVADAASVGIHVQYHLWDAGPLPPGVALNSVPQWLLVSEPPCINLDLALQPMVKTILWHTLTKSFQQSNSVRE